MSDGGVGGVNQKATSTNYCHTKSMNYFVCKKLPPPFLAKIETCLVELKSMLNQATSFLKAHEGGGGVVRDHAIQIVKSNITIVISQAQSILGEAKDLRSSWDEGGVCPFGTTPHCPSEDVSNLLVEALNLEWSLTRCTYPPGALPSRGGGGGAPPTPVPYRREGQHLSDRREKGGRRGETRGANAFLDLLRVNVQEVHQQAEAILRTHVNDDKDANEINRESEDIYRSINNINSELKSEIANHRHHDATINELYDLRADLNQIQATLARNLKTMFRHRGMHGRSTRTHVTKPKPFSGTGKVLEYIEWRKMSARYIESLELSEQQAVAVYQTELTTGLPREMISEMKTSADIITTLTSRFGNKNILVEEFKKDLRSIPEPDKQRPAAAADYVTTALTRIKRIMRISIKEADGLIGELADIKPQEPVLEVMTKHPTLAPYAAEFGRLYGEQNKKSGYVRSEQVLQFLHTCLSAAEESLLYVRTTQSTSVLHKAAATNKKDGGGIATNGGNSSGGSKGGGVGKDARINNKKNVKPNTKQINQASANKKPQAQNSSGKQAAARRPRICRTCAGTHGHVLECKEFGNLAASRRTNYAKSILACVGCLQVDPTMDWDDRPGWFANHLPSCNREFICQHEDCQKNKKMIDQPHVVLCAEHLQENQPEIDKFKKTNTMFNNIKFYHLGTSNLKKSDEPAVYSIAGGKGEGGELGGNIVPDVDCSPIFTLQHVDDGREGDLLVLYDSGALTSGIKESVAHRLNARTIRKGPISLSVVGGSETVVSGGVKSFTLPLVDGRVVTISAISMPEVTAPVAKYSTGGALSDLKKEFNRRELDGELPEVDEVVGGRSADLLLGAEYSYLFPQASPVFSLESGLGIGKAKLHSLSGKQGILWGIHRSWDNIGGAANAAFLVREELRAPLPPLQDESQPFLYNSPSEFMAAVLAEDEFKESRELKGREEGVDMWASGKCADSCNSCQHGRSSEALAAFYSLQIGGANALSAAALADAAVEVSYRCPTCRACSSCKNEDFEARSINEEREQALIQASVDFDPGEGKLTATLPFIKDPAANLHDNKHVAKKILERNWSKLNRHPEEKKEVIQSFKKLYDRGFIQKVDDLNDSEKELMSKSLIPSGGYVIPWQVVRKRSSVSTPVRLVMNAGSRTSSGSSLNDILAKGMNCVSSLYSTLINFRLGDGALSADIAKFYNQTRLNPEYYQYQRILFPGSWLTEMKEGGGEGEGVDAVDLVVKTLIYGLRPSGQQCAVGMSKLATYIDEQRPDLADGAAAIRRAYVDDILTPATPGKEKELASQISEALSLAGMEVKGFAISGFDPPAELSADGETVGVLGYVWDPKRDLMSLESKDIDLVCNKGKQINPRPSLDLQFSNSRLFTKRNILSLSLRLFDPLGLYSPIYGRTKLAVQNVVVTTEGWDTPVADEHKVVFRSIIEELTQLPSIKIPRAAVRGGEGGIELVCFCDASQSMMCVCVYARTIDNTGNASIHLLCAKQRLSHGSSIPRSELKALTMGVSVCHAIKQGCDKVETVRVLTDSAISLKWAINDHRPLSANVRNSVLEIRRLIDLSSLFHVRSAENLADIGTKVATLADVKPDSPWFVGHKWMKDKPKEWPVTRASALALSERERAEAGREMKSNFGTTILTISGQKVDTEEDLLVDPVRLGWERAIQIMDKVTFAVKWMSKNSKTRVYNGPKSAIEYFAQKSTKLLEARREEKELKRAGGVKQGGIWIYNARFLGDLDKLEGLETGCLDVHPGMFRVPMALADSKVGLAVMTACHQLNGHHRGVTATLVESLSVFHILGGRKLAGTVRSACPRCIFSQRRTLQQHLGPLHTSRLLVAPAFSWPAVDIAGPFVARCACGSNHRAKAKAWILVIRCPSTNAVSAQVMETLSSASAADAYSRHAARYGHAQFITSDRGSQFLSLWKKGQFSHTDLTTRLQSEFQKGGIRVTVIPAGDHSANGVAERAIKTIREMMKEIFGERTHSVLQLQTFAYYICNVINGIPFAISKAGPENLETAIISPNKLLLGHNNRRALAAPVKAGNLEEHVNQVKEVEEAFFKSWNVERIRQFVNDGRGEKEKIIDVSIGDIVVYKKLSTEMKPGSSPLRFARVKAIEEGSIGRVRSLELEYKPKPSKTYKVTTRSPDQVTIVARKRDMEDYVEAEPPDSEPLNPAQALPEVRDEFEPEEASASIYSAAQIVALTRDMG